MEEAIWWIIRIVVFAAVMLTMQGIVGTTAENLLSTELFEYDILAKRLIYSETGFSYQDRNGRIYHGIIDLENKFNTKTLNNFDKNRRSFYMRSILKEDDKQQTVEIYDDQNMFKDFEALTWSNQFGQKDFQRYVLVKDKENKLNRGLLNITIVYKI